MPSFPKIPPGPYRCWGSSIPSTGTPPISPPHANPTPQPHLLLSVRRVLCQVLPLCALQTIAGSELLASLPGLYLKKPLFWLLAEPTTPCGDKPSGQFLPCQASLPLSIPMPLLKPGLHYLQL